MTADSIRDEVPCPDCAEPILRAAKKCKHCGSWVEEIPIAEVVLPLPDPLIPCPQCAELTPRDALQCVHCESVLGVIDQADRPPSPSEVADRVASPTDSGIVRIVRESSSLTTPLRTAIRVGKRVAHIREGESTVFMLPYGEHVVTFQQLGLRDHDVSITHRKGVPLTLKVQLIRPEGIRVTASA